MKSIRPLIRSISKGESGAAATAQTTVARILFILLNIITGMITARILGPAGRGEQAAMILWPQFLAHLLTLGVPTAVIYHVKKHPQEQAPIVTTALLLSLLTGSLATAIGIILMPVWLAQYSSAVIQNARWLMLFTPLVSVSLICVAAMEAAEKFGAANRGRYLTPLVTLLGLVVLVLTHSLSPMTAVLAYLTAGAVTFAVLLRDVWRTYPLRLARTQHYTRHLLNYGVRSYGLDLFGSLSGHVDRVMVVGLLAPAAMGIYAIALSLSKMLNVLHSATISVLFPKTSARPVQEVVAVVGGAARISTFLTGMAALVVGLLGGRILTLLYGVRFAAAVPIFRILLLQVVLAGLTWVLSQTFTAVGRPSIPMLLQGIGLGLNLLLMLLLVPRFSLLGASVALLLATIFRLGVVLLCYPLVLKVSPPPLWLNQSDWSQVKRLRNRLV